jgi:hypothetical protein
MNMKYKNKYKNFLIYAHMKKNSYCILNFTLHSVSLILSNTIINKGDC